MKKFRQWRPHTGFEKSDVERLEILEEYAERQQRDQRSEPARGSHVAAAAVRYWGACWAQCWWR